MSLLNLGTQMDIYHSFHFLWEGKEQGEGYLRSVKSELTIGLNKKWQKWLLDNLHLEKSFKNITNNYSNDSSDDTCKSLKEIRFYKTNNEVILHTHTARPFVVLHLTTDFMLDIMKTMSTME